MVSLTQHHPSSSLEEVHVLQEAQQMSQKQSHLELMQEQQEMVSLTLHHPSSSSEEEHVLQEAQQTSQRQSHHLCLLFSLLH